MICRKLRIDASLKLPTAIFCGERITMMIFFPARGDKSCCASVSASESEHLSSKTALRIIKRCRKLQNILVAIDNIYNGRLLAGMKWPLQIKFR